MNRAGTFDTSSIYDNYPKDQYIVLLPAATVMQSSALYRISLSILVFDPEVDCYVQTKHKVGNSWVPKEYSFNNTGFSKIAAAGGISFLPSTIHESDDENVAIVTAAGVLRRPDGSAITLTKTKKVDARAYGERWQAKEEAKTGDWKKTPEQIRQGRLDYENQMRLFKTERAETGAMQRVITSIFNVKSTYTPEELKKKFVIPVVSVNMDFLMADPAVRLMAAQAALSSSSALFGGGMQRAPQALPQASQAGAGYALPAHADIDDTPDDLPPPPPAKSPQELIREKWDAADARDRVDHLNVLWTTKQHSFPPERLQEVLDSDKRRQVDAIVHLEGLPVLAAQGAPASPPPPRSEPPAQSAPPPPADRSGPSGGKSILSEKQIKRLFAIAKKAGYDSEGLHKVIAEQCGGITSVDDLDRENYNFLCGDERDNIESWLENNPAGSAPAAPPAGGGKYGDNSPF